MASLISSNQGFCATGWNHFVPCTGSHSCNCGLCFDICHQCCNHQFVDVCFHCQSLSGLLLFSSLTCLLWSCWIWGTHHQLCGTSKCLCGAFFLRFVLKFSTLEAYSWFCFPSGWSSIVCCEHSQKCLASCK